jgi:dsDNA-binding SOS-regulon protein
MSKEVRKNKKGMIVIRAQISNEKKQENNLANYLHNNKREVIKNIFQQTKDVEQNTVGSEEDISIDEGGYLYIFFHS